MDRNKKIIAGVAGVAVVGIVSYLGYKVFKELGAFDDDNMWENFDDIYNYRHPKSSQGSAGNDECPKPFL